MMTSSRRRGFGRWRRSRPRRARTASWTPPKRTRKIVSAPSLPPLVSRRSRSVRIVGRASRADPDTTPQRILREGGCLLIDEDQVTSERARPETSRAHYLLEVIGILCFAALAVLIL